MTKKSPIILLNDALKVVVFCRRHDEQREEEREEEQQTKTCGRVVAQKNALFLSLSLSLFCSSQCALFFSRLLLLSLFYDSCFLSSNSHHMNSLDRESMRQHQNAEGGTLRGETDHLSFFYTPLKITQTRNVRNKKCTRCARR